MDFKSIAGKNGDKLLMGVVGVIMGLTIQLGPVL